MLLEIAIGDAYGAGFEYCDPTFVEKHNLLKQYVQHPWHTLSPGTYTDDTQMSLALAELLLSGENWSPKAVTAHFLNAFHRDPLKGYSKAFQSFLQETHTPDQFLKTIRPYSKKNGAAMRSVPLGLISTIDEIKVKSLIQARVTHDTAEGTSAAVAVALMSHYFLYDLGPKDSLPAFLNEHVPVDVMDWKSRHDGKVGNKGLETVLAALSSIMETNSLADTLQMSVAFGGDVDTVAAIALGVASCSKEHDQNLPRFLFDELENNGEFGRDSIIEQDKRLAAFFKLPVVVGMSKASD